MPLLHIIILALIQGITEFLPISSSGHLALMHKFMNHSQDWNTHIAIDVAVHVGTLFAVLLYFRKDVQAMAKGLIASCTHQTDTENAALLKHVVIGSIPIIIAGFILNTLEPSWLLAVEIIAWTTLLFGILLWVADHIAPKTRDINDMTIKDAFLIGLSQTLSLIPGTSRSGITMTTARFLGFTRPEAAHFSLLLGMIAISGAGTLSGITMIEKDMIHETIGIMTLGACIAFAAGYASIALMMTWLQKCSFAPFAIYRIALGLILLGFIYWPAS